MNTKTVILICLGLCSLLAVSIEAKNEKATEAESEAEAENDDEEEEKEKPHPKLESVTCTMVTPLDCVRRCYRQKAVPSCCKFTNAVYCDCLGVTGEIPMYGSFLGQLLETQSTCVKNTITTFKSK